MGKGLPPVRSIRPRALRRDRARRGEAELFFNKVIGENAGAATCSGGGSGPGDLERTLPLLRAGHAVYVQGVVGNLNLPMCFATECRSIERALVNLFRFRSADRTCPRHCVSLMHTKDQRRRGNWNGQAAPAINAASRRGIKPARCFGGVKAMLVVAVMRPHLPHGQWLAQPSSGRKERLIRVTTASQARFSS